jgi:hypothetical protein
MPAGQSAAVMQPHWFQPSMYGLTQAWPFALAAHSDALAQPHLPQLFWT